MNIFEHSILKVSFNPTISLRYVFNLIGLLRYVFENRMMELRVLKMKIVNIKNGNQNCKFEKPESRIAVFRFQNQKTHFAISDFKSASYEWPCSKPYLSIVIGIKTILSEALGLKLRFLASMFKTALRRRLNQKTQFWYRFSKNAVSVVVFHKTQKRRGKSKNAI